MNKLMEQTKAEISGPKQPSKENQTLSVQPTCTNEMDTKGESTIEMSGSQNSAFSLKNDAREIRNNNMAGVVNGGMNNDNSKNINVHLHQSAADDVSELMSRLAQGGTGTINNVASLVFGKHEGCQSLIVRRTSQTEISLGRRTEEVKNSSNVTEDFDTNTELETSAITRAVLPNEDKNVMVYGESISDDDVDGERRLKEAVKLEVGTAVPETHPQTDMKQFTVCSSSEVIIDSPASAATRPLISETVCNSGMRYSDVDTQLSKDEQSLNVTSTSLRHVENAHTDVCKTMSPRTSVCTPSVQMNPRSTSSKTGPGNTVAEKPEEGLSYAGGGSLTCFSSMWGELANIDAIYRSLVEIIFKQIVTHAENLPKSTMITISSYFLKRLEYAMRNPKASLGESPYGHVDSLTDFKELEKKLRHLDDCILNVDFPVIMSIARFRPQMLPKILLHLNSFRAGSPASATAGEEDDVDGGDGGDDGDDDDDCGWIMV